MRSLKKCINIKALLPSTLDTKFLCVSNQGKKNNFFCVQKDKKKPHKQVGYEHESLNYSTPFKFEVYYTLKKIKKKENNHKKKLGQPLALPSYWKVPWQTDTIIILTAQLGTIWLIFVPCVKQSSKITLEFSLDLNYTS